MKTLNQNESEIASGGTALVGIGAFTSVFTFPSTIGGSIDTYSAWGSGISQAYWDYSYPYDPNSNLCYGPNC